MSPSVSALVRTGLSFAQAASFMVPNPSTAIALATGFAGAGTLMGIFFPAGQAPPPATQQQLLDSVNSLAKLDQQVAWNTALQGHMQELSDALLFYNSTYDDFTSGKFGDTPIAQLSTVLRKDWGKIYDQVKVYAALDHNPLLDAIGWASDGALADAKTANDQGMQKWITFELLPLYCTTASAYLNFCKLSLMLEFHDMQADKIASRPGIDPRLLPDDFMDLVPSPYFENAKTILLSNKSFPEGCIDHCHNTLHDYDTEVAGLQSDRDWRKGQITLQKDGDEFYIEDQETGFKSRSMQRPQADTQLALYQAKEVTTYLERQSRERGVGGLGPDDAAGLKQILIGPWDQLRRDIQKAEAKWQALQDAAKKAGGTPS